MIDVLGRAIEVHDIVTYPVRQGADMWMAVGRVAELHPEHITVAKFTAEGVRRVNVSTGRRVTIAVRGSMLQDLVTMGDTLGVQDD